jgi:cell division protein FtsI (penicillin-binding protein 3)
VPAGGGKRKRPVDVIDRRIGLLFAAFLLLLVVGIARAGYLGLVRAGSLQMAAAHEQVSTESIPAVRGTITDRDGVVLALSESADEVIADPYLIKDPQRVAAAIAPLLGLSQAQTYAGLTKPRTGYSILSYDLPAAQATKIAAMRIDGVPINGIYPPVPVEQRVYPRDTLASQVLGWVGSSNNGLGGIEYADNNALAGRPGRQRVVNDAVGQAISVTTERRMVPGKTVALTISAPLQSEVEQVLAWVGAEYQPKAATAIVMNPDSGQVLALGNWPAMNSNDVSATPFANTEDYGVGLSYEPGSTFKAVTVAGALQDGVVTPNTVFDVPPYLDPYGRMITDAESHGYEDLSVAGILKVSSNIGADLIGQKMGATSFSQWVNRFGFGKPTGIALPGEQDGVILPLDRYSGVSMFNLPFGQGQEVTPIQMATAYSAIANGGVLRTPGIVQSVGGKPVPKAKGVRIISSQTAAELRNMLRGVLADGGTASGAAIPGYDLAGKTGTAQVAVDGNYSNSLFVASFIGMVPASNPKLVVAVVVDEPQGDIYGGSVAAPAFQKIVGWAVPYFGINPCPSPCPASAMDAATPSTP